MKNVALSLCTVMITSVASSDQLVQHTQWRVEDGGNGHWYEIKVYAEQIPWPTARSEAESLGGYLVTITSQTENDFLWDAFVHDQQYWIYETHSSGTQVSHGPWIGGFQTCNSCSYQWVTGEAWNYDNWAAGEPYNHPNENYINFWQRSGHAPANQWNDGSCCSIALIVEYDADCNEDGIVDYGQILDGTLADTNDNGIPDECEDGDGDGNGNEGDLWVWGRNADGECDVPQDLLPIVEVEGAGAHVLVLQVDGSIRCWGRNSDGQCDPPIIDLPWVDVAGGDQHSIGLDAEGRVHCWGDNTHGQCDVPSDLPAAIAVGTGANHSLAVLADGSVVNWGYDRYGSLDVPAGLLDVVKVTGGSHHSVALRNDGSIVAWGGNDNESEIPGGHGTFVDVKASQYNSIALTSDGAVVVWGRSWFGQGNVPNDLGEVSLIGIGAHFAMVKTADNEMVCWGNTSNNECALPSGLLNADNLGSCNLHGTAWIASPLQIDDCNGDGIVDYGQILSGELADDDGNGIPDCCEQGTQCGCPADLNQDDKVDGGDISILLGWWGLDGSITPSPDLDGNGVVDGVDLTILLGAWSSDCS